MPTARGRGRGGNKGGGASSTASPRRPQSSPAAAPKPAQGDSEQSDKTPVMESGDTAVTESKTLVETETAHDQSAETSATSGADDPTVVSSVDGVKVGDVVLEDTTVEEHTTDVLTDIQADGDGDIAEDVIVKQEGDETATTAEKSSTQGSVKDNSEVIIEDEEEMDEDVAEGEAKKKKPGLYWQVTVCPIGFEKFCALTSLFSEIMKLCCSFEFRMSQHLLSCMSEDTARLSIEAGIPWLPNEKSYTKTRNAATTGLMEVVVRDSSLQELLEKIYTPSLSNNNRLRIEMKRVSITGIGHDRNLKTRTQKQRLSKARKKQGAGDLVLQPGGFVVNFAVRAKPVRPPAFKHEEGHVQKKEDNYIFLTKIPDEVPDILLKAILKSEMVERTYGENSTGSATFNITSPIGAQQYMELFDSILVNLKDIPMATTLGTLCEAKRFHADQMIKNRKAKETQKPKPALDSEHDSAAKKSHLLFKSMLHKAQKGKGRRSAIQQAVRGALLAAKRGQGPTQGGGRGMALQRGRGVPGAAQRGAMQRGAPQRGAMQRGAMQRGARGATAHRGGAQQRGRGVKGGSTPSRGVLSYGLSPRGKARGATPNRSRGGQRGSYRGPGTSGAVSLLDLPFAGRSTPSFVRSRDMEDLEARVLATRRELSHLEEQARIVGMEEHLAAQRYSDSFSPRRNFGHGRHRNSYDERNPYERGYRSTERRRW